MKDLIDALETLADDAAAVGSTEELKKFAEALHNYANLRARAVYCRLNGSSGAAVEIEEAADAGLRAARDGDLDSLRKYAKAYGVACKA